MTLSTGTRLGTYEIVAAVGAGGMGEVYKARDTQLHRDVAIKILPEIFANDPDRLSRFEREAQLLATLNHPHIAQIYGLEQLGLQRALVMEFVDGEALSDRLAAVSQRGLAPEEAVAIARQIADGLEAAHERGVIHRDLKPANIKVKPDGTIKLLDFGLAKALDGAGTFPAATPPTITSPALTAAGVVLGTAAYMSPEQVRGLAVDRRADIWAFGCVLFEMLTGTRLFDGATVTDTFADVLRKDIDWNRLPRPTPPAIVALLRRCLSRDARARLRDIGDARVAIDEHLASPASSETRPNRPPAKSARWPAFALVAIGAALAGAGAVAVSSRSRAASTASIPPVHVSIELGEDLTLFADLGVGPNAVLSPDGTLLVFAARKAKSTPQLYVRRLDQPTARPLAGTEGAIDPFFSPDGRSVGFFANGKLNTIPVVGGAVTPLVDTLSDRGGAWARDGTIVYTPDSARGVTLQRVSSTGGAPQPASKLEGNEVTHRWPQVLPGGQVLYTAHSQTGSYDVAQLVVSSLSDISRKKTVYRGGYHGRYLPTGHLAFINKSTLFVIPFDLSRLEVTGPAVPLIEGVTSDATSAGAEFSVSDGGALVYSGGKNIVTDVTIAWVDGSGATSPLRAIAGDYFTPRFSPDGNRLALEIGSNWGDSAIWAHDIKRETLTRLTFGGQDLSPVWSPDGKRIAFSSQRPGDVVEHVYWQRVDRTATPQRLTSGTAFEAPSSWHPNGKLLAFFSDKEGKTPDIDVGVIPIEGDETTGWKFGTPQYILAEPFVEVDATFSPDGRWLAYTSLESGRPEVFVRSFPDLQQKVQVSVGGGFSTAWSRTRRELFYGTEEGGISGIAVVPYRIDNGSFVPEKPHPVARGAQWAIRSFTRGFDLHPDGRRFAVLTGSAPPVRTHLVFMSHFFDAVRRAADVKATR